MLTHDDDAGTMDEFVRDSTVDDITCGFVDDLEEQEVEMEMVFSHTLTRSKLPPGNHDAADMICKLPVLLS